MWLLLAYEKWPMHYFISKRKVKNMTVLLFIHYLYLVGQYNLHDEKYTNYPGTKAEIIYKIPVNYNKYFRAHLELLAL